MSLSLLQNSMMRFFGKSQKPTRKWRIFSGDVVYVIDGHEKGKVGKIIKVNRKEETFLIEGVNVEITKVPYDTEHHTKGEEVADHKPLHCSKVNLLDPATKKPTRISIGYLEDGTMVRIAKKTGSIIELPNRDDKKYVNRHKNKIDGPLDTPGTLAHEITYKGENLLEIKSEFDEYISEKERIENLLVFKD